MRLLFAVKSLNVGGGGAERVLVDVANGMANRGHAVQVLTFDRPGLPSFYPLLPAIGRIDLAIAEPGLPTPRGRFLRSMLKIRQSALLATPDLVVPFLHSTYVPLMAALLGSRVRVVLSEHANASHFASRPLQRALVSVADRMALAKTVPAKPVRDSHPRSIRKKVHVLPNPIDLQAFTRFGGRPANGPPVLLCVGRFMQEKNHAELLRAFARIAPAFPEWRLKLVGDGVLREQLEQDVENLGLRGRVLMPGASSDVASEYAAASIVVVPSHYESFGLVAAEALASSRPVIAFDDCGGVTEFVRDGENGMLVGGSGDRVGNLATGLECLMRNAPLGQRLGAAGPAAVKHLGMDEVLGAWERFFITLVSGARHA